MNTTTTTDYTGRQLDVELLQSITKPAELIPVTVSNVSTPPKLVAGIQKLVQRYALLLLTNVGEVKFDQEQGGDLMRLLLEGYVQDVGQLQYAFAYANDRVTRMLNEEDINTDLYVASSPDEQISTATLLDAQVDKVTSTAYLRVYIVSQAGEDFTFVVPVTRK